MSYALRLKPNLPFCLCVVAFSLSVTGGGCCRLTDDWNAAPGEILTPAIALMPEPCCEEPQWAIREAVLRYLFEHNESYAQQSAPVYFILLEDDQDAPQEFLERFSDHTPPVFAGSMMEYVEGGVRLKGDQRFGLLFRISTVHVIDTDSAVVRGGYFEDGLSASGHTYAVQHTTDGWQVTDLGMDWIS